MNNQICKYCNKDFNHVSQPKYANHIKNCVNNPRKEEYRRISNDAHAILLNETMGEKKVHIKTCKKCNSEYEVVCRQSQLLNPKVAKQFCSRACANSRIRTDEFKHKLSVLMKTKPHTLNNFKNRIYTKKPPIPCAECNKPFRKKKPNQKCPRQRN